MGKGFSAIVTAVIITLITTVSVSLVVLVGRPVIERAYDSSAINEALNNMRSFDDVIREVASEGVGSLRHMTLKISHGVYRVNNETGSLEFEYEVKSDLIGPGTYSKQGNIMIMGSLSNARAYENSTHLILENEILKVYLQKVGSEESPALINTSENIKAVEIKSTGDVVVPEDTSVMIGNSTNTTYGEGYSKLVYKGKNLPKAQALFHVATQKGIVYDILYTLRSGADFLEMEVRNVTNNQTTLNMIYALGSAHSNDVIVIGGNVVTGNTCYTSSQLTYFYACSQDAQEFSGGRILGIVYTRSSGSQRICFENRTSNYKFNMTVQDELHAIIVFTKGNCSYIHQKMYLVEKQGVPSSSIYPYSLEIPQKVKVNMILKYRRIRIDGKDRFSEGTHKICIKKTGEEHGMAVVKIFSC